MKIYWIKNALTTGIEILEVSPVSYDRSIFVSLAYDFVFFDKNNKNEWYRSKEIALFNVEKMRRKKIICLKKQIKKIQFLKIKFKEEK